MFGFLEFWSFVSVDICSVFSSFCILFVCCALLAVYICSFLRAPKTESDFRCTKKAEFTDYWYYSRFVLLLLALLPKL